MEEKERKNGLKTELQESGIEGKGSERNGKDYQKKRERKIQ